MPPALPPRRPHGRPGRPSYQTQPQQNSLVLPPRPQLILTPPIQTGMIEVWKRSGGGRVVVQRHCRVFNPPRRIGGRNTCWMLLHATGRLIKEASRVIRREPVAEVAAPKNPAPQPIAPIRPLKRLLLTDGVSHTLFEEFAAHRQSTRGEEETGWVLLGIRDGDAASFVVATLPAGVSQPRGGGSTCRSFPMPMPRGIGKPYCAASRTAA